MALPAQTSLLRRLIVGVALLGIVVVTHLALQKAGGFEGGCLGLGDIDFTTATTGETAGCAAVTESEYADFRGISNIALGLIFYVLLSALRLGYAVLRDDRLRLASFAMVGVGFAYTLYLVYLQAAVIKSFCPLCMTSAALVLTLLILHILEHMRLRSSAPVATDESPRRRRAAPEPTGLATLRPYLPILGGFAVLLLGAFMIAPESVEEEPSAIAASTQPTDLRQLTGACTFDPGFEPIADMSALLNGPSKGTGDVTVIKVFDPNCPHCRALSETLDSVIAQTEGAATYHYVPYPLRQQSLGQVVVLKMAAQQGLFFEMMQEMFDRQDNTWGMALPELIETVDAVGMDGSSLEAMFEDESQLQPYLDEIKAEADAVTAAFATDEGGISVPKLAINGRVVESTFASYSERCLAQFIADAETGTGTAAPADPDVSGDSE